LKNKGRLWTSVIIGLAAVALLFLTSPKQLYNAAGIMLPAKQTRPAISPSSVVRMARRPVGSKLLGQIRIERKYPAKGQLAEQQIWALAQKLAASVGANAAVIKLFQVGSVTKGYYIYVFWAEAVYAPDMHSALDAITYVPPIGVEF